MFLVKLLNSKMEILIQEIISSLYEIDSAIDKGHKLTAKELISKLENKILATTTNNDY
jgi:hypothetical protein